MEESQNFGFIIQRVDEDDLLENLENEDHEVREYLFLKSNNDDFKICLSWFLNLPF